MDSVGQGNAARTLQHRGAASRRSPGRRDNPKNWPAEV